MFVKTTAIAYGQTLEAPAVVFTNVRKLRVDLLGYTNRGT